MPVWERVLLGATATLRDAIELLDRAGVQIVLVVDQERHLLGTLTDGDVRSAMLRGIGMEAPVTAVANSRPTTGSPEESPEVHREILLRKRFRHLPLVDPEGRVVGLRLLEDLFQGEEQRAWVVLMAGGQGTRLRPLTERCPKPLLPVGTKPLLETIVETFGSFGFRDLFISTNYRGGMIEDYFGDGTPWGVRIAYLREKEPLGTCGSLALLPQRPAVPVIVMNGDILTRVDFRALLRFHEQRHFHATMCVHEHAIQVPYGVVETQDDHLRRITEKPEHRCLVNSGIYVLEPVSVDLIRQEGLRDMPQLLQIMVDRRYRVGCFPLREYWLDIGHMGDYERANAEFGRLFEHD